MHGGCAYGPVLLFKCVKNSLLLFAYLIVVCESLCDFHYFPILANSIGIPSFYIADTYGEDTEHHCKYGCNFYQCCEYGHSYSLSSLNGIIVTSSF